MIRHSVLLVALLACFAGLQGCASVETKPSGLQFNSVEVINLTNDDIHNMQIEVTRLHRKFACGIVLHGSICMNGFYKRVLQENDIEISWEQRGLQHRIGPVKIHAPESYDPNTVHVIQFVLNPDKRLETRFGLSPY